MWMRRRDKQYWKTTMNLRNEATVNDCWARFMCRTAHGNFHRQFSFFNNFIFGCAAQRRILSTFLYLFGAFVFLVLYFLLFRCYFNFIAPLPNAVYANFIRFALFSANFHSFNVILLLKTRKIQYIFLWWQIAMSAESNRNLNWCELFSSPYSMARNLKPIRCMEKTCSPCNIMANDKPLYWQTKKA